MSAAKSHNVCIGCRARKKKCDGERPSCASCLKRGDICFYAGAPSQGLSGFQVTWPEAISGASHANSFPVDVPNDAETPSWQPTREQAPPTLTGFDQTGQMAGQQPQPSSSTSNAFAGASDMANNGLPSPEESIDDKCSLPPPDKLRELLDLFFEKFYVYLPIVHKSTIFSKLQASEHHEKPLLFLAIIAFSASWHPDPAIRDCQQAWFDETKRLYLQGLKVLDSPVDVLQASVFITLQSALNLDYPTLWMTLGEGWRKAVSMEFGACDAERRTHATDLMHRHFSNVRAWSFKNWIEYEEYRRSIWMLFILDRNLCFPLGLTHAIDDRQLKLYFPMHDDFFQNSVEPPREESLLYTQNLDRLITAVQTRARQKKATMMQFLLLAYVFLGHVSEAVYSLDSEEAREELLNGLEPSLLRIRLMMPRYATDLAAADYRDFAYVGWLNVVLASASVHFHHGRVGSLETLESQVALSAAWPHCLSAARSCVAVLRDLGRTPVDPAMNPHIASLLFISCRILIMEYMCPSEWSARCRAENSVGAAPPRDPALRDDIELAYYAFDRMKEHYKGVGTKFRNAMIFYIKQGEARMIQSRTEGGKDTFQFCAQWQSISEQTSLSDVLPLP